MLSVNDYFAKKCTTLNLSAHASNPLNYLSPHPLKPQNLTRKCRSSQLLWLPPVVQEVFDHFSACDRLRASFRPILSGTFRSRGRYGDQRIGSKSSTRSRGTKLGHGFPNPDLFDRCAHSGHCTLTLPLAPTLAGYDTTIMPRVLAPDLGNPHSSSASPRSGGPSCSPA